MTAIADVFKALRSYLDKGDEHLRFVSDEADGMLRSQKYHPLYDGHPGLDASAGHLFAPAAQKWMHEITVPSSGLMTRNAVSMVSPEEFFQTFGRPDVTDPAVRQQVRRLAHDATQGNGINEIVILDADFADDALTVEGVQGREIMAALAEIDPKAKVPVVLRTMGVAWDTDYTLPTSIKYRGVKRPLFDVPRYATKVGRSPSDAIADAKAPDFYQHQARTPTEYKQKVASLLSPENALFHSNGRDASQFGAIGEGVIPGWSGWARRGGMKAEPLEIEAAKAAYRSELDTQASILAGVMRDGETTKRVSELLGDTPYTRALYGETGASKDAPLVFFRGSPKQLQTLDPSSVGRAIEEPQEFGAHFGTLGVAEQFVRAKSEIQVATEGAKSELIRLFDSAAQMKDAKPALERAMKAAIMKGKRTPLPGQPVDQIDVPTLKQELDFHLTGLVKEGANLQGLARNLAHAADRATGSAIAPRLFTGKRGLMLFDAQGWYTDKVARQMLDLPEFKSSAKKLKQIIEAFRETNAPRSEEAQALTRELQQLIESKGYDHISYLNNYERHAIEGHNAPTLSIISWRNEQFISPYSPRLHGVENQNRLMKDVMLTVLAGLELVHEADMPIRAEKPTAMRENDGLGLPGYYEDENGRVLYFDGKNVSEVPRAAATTVTS